jgi:hypothetical protein
MRTKLATVAAFIALASCGSSAVVIQLDHCWTVSIGDRVQGSALLFAFPAGCTECGSFVAASKDCSTTPITLGGVAADKAYRDILRTSRQDSLGMISRAVTLSGVAVPRGNTDKPMIRLERLVPLDLRGSSK